MHLLVSVLVVGLTSAVAVPTRKSTIVGGTAAVINQYPSVAALLYSSYNNLYNQACTGTIITNKAILTAAHCVYGDSPSKWRARVGSSWANSGGSVLTLNAIVTHPNFNLRTLDNDIVILRTTTAIVYTNVVKPASIAGAYYNLPDNQVVWAVGWGSSSFGGTFTEQLRHVQAYTINQSTCSTLYSQFGAIVTPNMLCSGLAVMSGRNQCQGDAGGPLYHNGVVVGIRSWSNECANPAYPTVYARVSRLVTWIQSTA